MKRLATLIAIVLVAVGAVASPVSAADDPETGSIVGVVDGDPSAVAGAAVVLSPGPGEDTGRSTSVAADGSYRFDGLATQVYGVQVSSPGSTQTSDVSSFGHHSSASVTVIAGRVATAPTQHLFLSGNVGHIDIVDPVNNQGDFSVWAADDPNWPVIGRAVATNGAISSFSLAPGRYKIQGEWSSWFGGRSFASATVYTVRPGETVSVQTPRLDQQMIRGTAPLEGVRVTAYAADDPTEILQETTTDDRGDYYLYGFSPDGRYKVRGVDPSGRLRAGWVGGASFATAQAIEADGWDDESHYLPMDRADGTPSVTPTPVGVSSGTVKGTVSGPGVEPNRRSMTMVDAGRGDLAQYDSRFVDDNTYEFDRLPPGDYKMFVDGGVWVGGRSFDSARVFHVESGKTLTEDIVYPLSGLFRATVLNPSGRPVPGVMVEMHTASGPDEIVARVVPDQYGYLRFGRLPIDRYTFRVVDPAGRYAETWAGGGTSRASAESFTPVAGEGELDPTLLPDTFLRPILHPLLAPVIAGTATSGHSLVATTQGTWSMSGLDLKGQWLRDGSPIAGETGSNHQLGSADVGRRVSYRVTASKAGQPTREAESRSVTAAAAPPTAVRPRAGRMSLKAGMGRHASKLRVRISAPGLSPSKVHGTVTVRDRHGARRVSAVMRHGMVTISLRRIKNGSRTLDVSFKGSSSLTVPQRSIRLRVR